MEQLNSIYHEGYDGFKEDQTFATFAARFVRSSLSEVAPPPAKLLDFGCGNGQFLRTASSAGYSTVGVDISEAAVIRCRSIGLEAHRIAEFDPSKYQETFDVVTLWDVLEHLPKPAEVLSSVTTVLRHGGYLVVKSPGPGAFSVQISAMFPSLAGAVVSAPSHNQFFTSRSLTRLLELHGFHRLTWLPPASIRDASKGGSLAKQAARRITRLIHTVSRDRSLIVMAQKA